MMLMFVHPAIAVEKMVIIQLLAVLKILNVRIVRKLDTFFEHVVQEASNAAAGEDEEVEWQDRLIRLSSLKRTQVIHLIVKRRKMPMCYFE